MNKGGLRRQPPPPPPPMPPALKEDELTFHSQKITVSAGRLHRLSNSLVRRGGGTPSPGDPAQHRRQLGWGAAQGWSTGGGTQGDHHSIRWQIKDGKLEVICSGSMAGVEAWLAPRMAEHSPSLPVRVQKPPTATGPLSTRIRVKQKTASCPGPATDSEKVAGLPERDRTRSPHWLLARAQYSPRTLPQGCNLF